MKVIRYEVKFKRGDTVLFIGIYKSRKAMRKAKDGYDNKYGAYLSTEVVEVLEDLSKRKRSLLCVIVIMVVNVLGVI